MSPAPVDPEAALEYAARGLAVLPCAARGKRPLVEHGLHGATTDPELIREWWSQWPTANIGIRTGAGSFHVLDVDGPEGVETIRALGAEHGRPVRGPTVRTSTGSWHYYFRAPRRTVGNRARFVDGCDWRGERGYVIVPPSIGSNGVPYEWVRDLEVPLPDVPRWLLDLLLPMRPSVQTRQVIVRGSSAYANKAAELECFRVAGAAVGTRNDALNRAAFNIGTLVGAGLLDESVATHSLYTAAQRAGLPDKETIATIESGLRAGVAHPREVKR
jgi:Bifunctional DNA primase/polymerase, N-terminal